MKLGVALEFISGCMVGIEFPGGIGGCHLVIDLAILRVLFFDMNEVEFEDE